MKRSFKSDDILQFRTISDPQVSPDGSKVAWVLTWFEPSDNQYHSAIQLTDLTRKTSRAWTAGPQDTHPRWSPDGRFLAYQSRAPDWKQTVSPVAVIGRGSDLVICEISGERKWTMRRVAGGVSDPSWSPDGRHLAFTTYVDPEKGLCFDDEVAPETSAYARFNADVLRVKRLQWKADGVGFLGDYFQHVAVVAFDPDSEGFASPRLVARGTFDLMSPTWAPDGTALAVVGNMTSENEKERRAFVYLLSPDDEFEPLELFGLEEMRSSALAFSPDGRKLVLSGHDDPQLGHYGNQQLWGVSIENRRGTCLTRNIDLTFGNYSRDGDIRGYGGEDKPVWLPGSAELLVLANEKESTSLYLFSVIERKLTRILDSGGAVLAFTTDAARQRAVLLYADESEPGDLYLLDLTEADPKKERLTTLNQELLDTNESADVLPFEFQSEGIPMQGWVVRPPNASGAGKVPLLLFNGGGPGGMRTGLFSFQSQLLAAHGYAVLHANVRGNQGRGESFSSAIRGRWGEADYRDNMNALTEALARFDFLDRERLGVFGGSYGGYMTNWMISRHPEFKAAVSINCVFNRLSHFGTGDMTALLNHVEFDRQSPWDANDIYWEYSPMRYVDRIRTPTLVIHAEDDHRCPVEQGEQLYFALKYLGVPSELVRIGNDSHGIRAPWHRVLRYDVMLEWFSRWLKEDG